MASDGIDKNFDELYNLLMKTNFVASKAPAFGNRPSKAKIASMVKKGVPFIPTPFRDGYIMPLLDRLDSILSRQGAADAFTVETLTGCVYQHAEKAIQPPLSRFLAVISDLYVSFLDRSERRHLQIMLSETLPPLAVFQSNASNGPFTIPYNVIRSLTGGTVGVVSLPATFADHPLLYGSLSHETGGHDVIHADHGLMKQLREQVHSAFPGPQERWQALLWDYWMDEAAADVYGVLNMGPTFGANLALLLAVFIAQGNQQLSKKPGLRNESGADYTNAMDVHPTDLLRLALVQGVVQSLKGLSQSTRESYVAELAQLSELLGNGATTIALTGQVTGIDGRSMYFEQDFPLATMQAGARKVGAMIATTKLAALAEHSVQDIETWDDSDENTALQVAGRLSSGFSVVSAGDDAQLMAGLTLAALQQPALYAAYSKSINDALDDSFAKDPLWGPVPRDLMVVKPSRTLANPEVQVDPYIEQIIDYNPLDEDAVESLGEGVSLLTRHEIKQIPWPSGLAPTIDKSFSFKGTNAELPQADFVIFTWTSAEANAMAEAMTPGIWAMPPKGAASGWYEYTNQWSKYAGRFTRTSPALEEPYIAKYMPICIDGRKVLLVKSNFHMARDNASMPVKDMFKQVIEQTKPKLVITSGTSGAIGSKFILGDVMVTNAARFKLDGTFKNAPFNRNTFTSAYTIPANGKLAKLAPLIAPNEPRIKAAHTDYPNDVLSFKRSPQIFTPATPRSQTGEPPVIVTTDKFEYDTKQNSFKLQGKGSMVEMGDAVLGLAVSEMGNPVKWLAIRNASDPQMSTKDSRTSSSIYKQFGYWTSIVSTLAAWACVLDFP